MVKVSAGGGFVQRRSLVLYAALSLVGGAVAATLPWLIGAILDSVQLTSAARLNYLIIALAVALGVDVVCSVSRHVVAERIKLRVAADLRTRVALKVARAATEVAGRTSPSQVATVVSSDIERVAGYPAARIRLAASVLSMVVVAGYLMTISPLVALTVVCGVPMFMWLGSPEHLLGCRERGGEDQRCGYGARGDGVSAVQLGSLAFEAAGRIPASCARRTVLSRSRVPILR